MNLKFKKETGILSILLGIFTIIIQPLSSNITGAVIDISSVSSRIGFFLGLGMVIVGAVLLQSGTKESGLVHIVKSSKFAKAIKKHPLGPINTAIGKIGTGLGKQHELTGNYKGKSAIKTSKGGRIVYEQEGKTITLTDYLPGHKY